MTALSATPAPREHPHMCGKQGFGGQGQNPGPKDDSSRRLQTGAQRQLDATKPQAHQRQRCPESDRETESVHNSRSKSRNVVLSQVVYVMVCKPKSTNPKDVYTRAA